MGQRLKFTSPSGTAVYPHLNKPDTQFNPDGVYKTDLSLEDCQELMDMAHNLAVDEFGATAKFKMPFKVDEETGQTLLRVKSKYAPKIYDSTGEILVGAQIPLMWGGSTLKVGGFMTTYTVSGTKGVSLQLTKVQVINPVGGGTSSNDGFDSVEGGYVAEEITKEAFEDVVEQTEAQADKF